MLDFEVMTGHHDSWNILTHDNGSIIHGISSAGREVIVFWAAMGEEAVFPGRDSTVASRQISTSALLFQIDNAWHDKK